MLGVGFAATRDLVSFLRNERADDKGTANPLLAAGQGGDGTGVRHTMAFGGSQAGRYLRHFIELGMNKDERGRRVLDGVYSHTAGAGKVFANHTFGQSGRTAAQHEDRLFPENWFPFSTASTTDPFTGKTGALLKGDASDPLHHRVDHLDRILAEGRVAPHHRPVRHARPRAAGELARLSDLRHPARRRRRAAAAQRVLRQSEQPAQPDAGDARARRRPRRLSDQGHRAAREPRALDRGRHGGRGLRGQDAEAQGLCARARAPIGSARRSIGSTRPAARDHREAGRIAMRRREVYGTRVSAVDADGNEVAGIRLPDIVAPLATYTGWNVYKSAPSELCDRDGSYVPFAKTKAEREAAGDPRLSLEERYGSRAAYVAKAEGRGGRAGARARCCRRTRRPMSRRRRRATGSENDGGARQRPVAISAMAAPSLRGSEAP